ncbi:MAG: Wzz/FepE/Etk N-terminal domain-containing protein [Solirubrobacteraceae bacterium]
MNDTPHYTTLRDYLRVVREQRVLIVLVVLVFVGAAIGLSLRADEVYEARASLSFRSPNDDLSLIGAPVGVSQTAEERAATGAEAIATFDNAQLAGLRLAPPLQPEALLSKITLQAEARTNFVVVQSRAGTAKRAAQIANAFADTASDELNKKARRQYAARARDLELELEQADSQDQGAYGRAINADRIQRLRTLARFASPVVVAVPARESGSPISPKPVRNALLGLLAGITLALLAAFVRDGLDRRFRTSREMVEELKLPLLGHVPDNVLGLSIGGNGRRALTDTELESFRILRTNIDFLDVDRESTSIVVSSAAPEEGKSTVAGALSAAYASTGRKVLLVECDLRRPTLAKRLGISPAPGLTDFLVGDAAPQEILQTVTVTRAGGTDGTNEPGRAEPTFTCITAGTTTRRPAELLASVRFETFLAEVEEAYDVVIVDSAPLLSIVDTLEIIPHVGCVVMCVRASRTSRDQARAAKAALGHFPEPRPAGLVVTGMRPGEEGQYGYYSYAYTSEA